MLMNLHFRPGGFSRRTSSTAAAALSLVAVVSASAAVFASAAPASADTLTFRVANYDHDGTRGVYLRNSTNVNDVNRDAAHYVTYGTTVELICGAFGSAVGPKGNTSWDYVRVLSGANSGEAAYLSEHWVDTPVGPNQHVGGEPACGSPGAAPVARPRSVAQRAVDWAMSHNNQRFDSGYCLRFVEQAYAAAGVNIGTGGTAARYWATDPRSYSRHADQSPETGSLVFWGATRSNSAGHVGIYIGNDTVVSTSSWPEHSSGTTVHTWSLSGRNRAGYPYLGWMPVA